MILYKNLNTLVLYGVSVDFRVILENGMLICRLTTPEENGNGGYGFHMLHKPKVTYNGEEKPFGMQSLYVSEAVFDYTADVKTLWLSVSDGSSAQQIHYNGLYYGRSFPVTLREHPLDVTCTFLTESVHEDYRNRIRWTLTESTGKVCAAVKLLYYEKAPNETDYTCTKLFFGRNESGRYIHALPEGTLGRQCYYRLAYCTYPSTLSKDEDYLTYEEYTSEVFTIGETKKYPAAPALISSNRPAPGGYAHVVWSNSADGFNEIVDYELERQVNGGAWVLVYRGGSTAFADKINLTSADTIAYRVRTVNPEGYMSDWKESETLSVIQSNLFVKTGGVIRPATQIYIGGHGSVGAIALVGMG